MNTLEQKIDNLPTNPGVYIFKDREGNDSLCWEGWGSEIW